MSLQERGGAGSASGYQQLVFELPESAEPRLVGELWDAGTLGLEVGDAAGGTRRVVAYFAAAATAAACVDRVSRQCPDVELRASERLPERDWLSEYRRHARPRPLGRGLLIDPGEPEAGRAAAASPARRLLRLPARRAFGTGEHATTRLAAEWLDDLAVEDARVLDVGCGSGILSFAARIAGARIVVAVEIDPVAALIAGQFQRLNGLCFALAAGRAACLSAPGGFDLLLVNVLPEAVRDDLDDLRRLLAPGGRALFSGLIDEGVDQEAERLRDRGFMPLERRRLDGWSALLTGAVDSAAPGTGAAPC